MLEAFADCVEELVLRVREGGIYSLDFPNEWQQFREIAYEAFDVLDSFDKGNVSLRLHFLYMRVVDATAPLREGQKPVGEEEFCIRDAFEELHACVRAINKRVEVTPSKPKPTKIDGFVIDSENFTVFQKDRPLLQTRNSISFRILYCLYEHYPHPVSFQVLRDEAWVDQIIEDSTIYQSVCRVRNILRDNDFDAVQIISSGPGHYMLKMSDNYQTNVSAV
jgi:hypothetical protein